MKKCLLNVNNGQVMMTHPLGQPGLHTEFQNSQSYTVKPCLIKSPKTRGKKVNNSFAVCKIKPNLIFKFKRAFVEWMHLKLYSCLFYRFTLSFLLHFYLCICVLERGYVLVSVSVCMCGGQRSTYLVFKNASDS